MQKPRLAAAAGDSFAIIAGDSQEPLPRTYLASDTIQRAQRAAGSRGYDTTPGGRLGAAMATAAEDDPLYARLCACTDTTLNLTGASAARCIRL